MAKLEVAREVTGGAKPGIERLAAHSKAAQSRFDQLIGFTEEEVELGDIALNSVLSSQEALLFAQAIGHSNYSSCLDSLFISSLEKEEAEQAKHKHPDPYFTDHYFSEYLKEVCRWNGQMVVEFAGSREVSDNTLPHWKRAIQSSYGCSVHSSSDLSLHELIELSSPLTDDSGSIVAKNLLQPILEKIGLNTTLEKCLAGTPFNFVFEVKTTNMKKPVVFSGWPDHVLLKGQLGVRRNRLDRLIGVGETQSPPGESRRALAAAVAQAGIYALGQIIRSNSNRLVVLVLSKGKRVALLLMSVKESSLYYKYAGSSDGFDLTDSSSLQLLAIQLKLCIQWQQNSEGGEGEKGQIGQIVLITPD